MRSMLSPYSGAEALNYLGIIATELLGIESLKSVIGLLSGFEAMTATVPAPAERALRRLRMAHFRIGTERDVAVLISAYVAMHRIVERQRRRGDPESPNLQGRPARFAFGPNLSVRRLWGESRPADIEAAIADLLGDAALRPEPLALAKAGEQAGFEGQRSPWGVSALDFEPAAPPVHDLDRAVNPPAPVTWVALVERAQSFDTKDRAAGRQPEDGHAWFGRLHLEDGTPRVVLEGVTDEGLEAAGELNLSGIRHLIGLPGAGKTTLLYLLAAELAERGHKVAFLFPSIRVSLAFIEVLALYDVDVGLLSGQSESTRGRHLTNYAASLRCRQSVADVPPTAMNFSTVCALSAFATGTDESFPHNRPPCLSVQQVSNASRSSATSKHRCVLSSVCGRQHAERSLTRAPIWAGHVLSLDRGVNRLYSKSRLHHFEMMARTFDLVVVDECDGAQSILDARGAPSVSLYGEESSLSAQGGRMLERATNQDNARFHGDEAQSLIDKQVALASASKRMANHIASMANKKLRERYANQLVTTVSLIADLFEDFDEPETHRAHFEWVWDWASKSVAFNDQLLAAPQIVPPTPDDDRDDEDVTEKVSLEVLSRRLSDAGQGDADVIAELIRKIQMALIDWDRTGLPEAMQGVQKTLRDLPWLPRDLDGDALDRIALLVVTTLVVLKHMAVAPYLRLMESLEMLDEGYEAGGISSEMGGFLPESLVGRLNGVRYVHDDATGVRISHVAFAGTPRLLLRRLHRPEADHRLGPSLLLTSATSFLGDSPSYHVDVGPDYLLRRPHAGTGWSKSVYRFLPLSDITQPGAKLRFSGSRLRDREQVLEAMVTSLLGQEPSPVRLAMQENDVEHGVQRRAAFIVNSYTQCRIVYDAVSRLPEWSGRVRYLVNADVGSSRHRHGVLASEVEDLGRDPDWDLLIFPMSAIGRGVNIVFQFGPRRDEAMLGSLYFLTRPHPRVDGLELVQGLIGRAGAQFEQQRFPDLATAEARRIEQRRALQRRVRALLRTTQVGKRLPADVYTGFVADQMCIILQTIGRAMRGDRPAFVYFVDAAWAPNSAQGEEDDARSSLLIAIREQLAKMLSDPHPGHRQCYDNLYRPFSQPMSNIYELKG